MVILREYKSVIFWLIFVSLWIIGCLPKCNEDETTEKVNTNENKQPNKIIKKIGENNKKTEGLDNNIKEPKKRNEELSNENLELIKKNEEIIKAKEEIKKAKDEFQLKEKELNEKNEKLKKKEKEIIQRENKINKANDDLKIKENDFNKRNNDFNKRNSEFLKKNEEFKKNYEKLIKEKNEIEIKLNYLNNKDKKTLDIKSNLINEEIDEIKKNSLDKLEEKLKKEKEENEKQKELNKKKEANIKILENAIEKKKQKLLEKENEIFIDIKKREDKLKEDQKKFNKEKLFYENIIDQKEDSFKKRELAIKKDKIFLENERKKLEMAKLPTEIGLQNIGATCYMNATLQALSNTGKFTEYFLKNYQYNQNNHNRKMSNEMYRVLFNLWSEEKKKGDYPPYDFKKALSEENPLFAGIQANDSKDLINFLLERFHQELNNPNIIINNQGNNFVVDQTNEIQTLNNFITDYFNNNKSIITDCFYGLLETKSKCGGCNCIKYNFQIYSFLEFPLKDINNYMYQNGKRYALVNQDGTNPDIDLYECFDYYQKIELMTGPNQMFCNICNGNRDTFYGSLIYSLPNYLIINLNRGKGAVYSCNVKFPDTLNLLNYVTCKNGITAMKLYAVICHYGPSNMGGHFIAFCRHRITNKWYKYNDSLVTLCTKDKEYLQGMPYILFYQAV